MHTKVSRNQKDSAILTFPEYKRIKNRSLPPQVDTSLEEDRARQLKFHEKTLEVTSQWQNSIENSRKERLNRLKVQQEETEREKQLIDEREAAIREEKRQVLLARAAERALQDMPEIRDVNSKLLLQETMRDRQKQMTIKEEEQRAKNRRDYQYDLDIIKKIKEDEEKEKERTEIAKQKKREWAEELKRVKGDAEIAKLEKREKEMNDEQLLARETIRLGELGSQKEIERKRWEREQALALKRENYKAKDKKESQAEKDLEEDFRLREEREQILLEEQARVRAKKEKEAERQRELDRVADARAKELIAIQKEKERFDSTMDGLQFEKDTIAIMKEKEKQERIREERRRDYLETLKQNELKKDASKKAMNPKYSFPDEGNELADIHRQRKQNLLDIAAYQRRQAEEKRDRELKEKDRKRLEFLRDLELDDANTIESQEYAKEMLSKTRKKRI